jgi:murein DD-endopeptidase MepM/ murein hydrolase activator NlpD
MQAQVEAQLRAAQAGPSVGAGPIRHGSGQLIWPVNGPITSPFCERRPWEACHPGIDIGVPSGTPIRAADGGRVAIAGWEGGYGNYTCIQHTASLSTCYGHQSVIKVSVGESVSQGQIIGLTGCTGLCFGPHLHFEVRINGGVVNPLNYL